MGAGRGRQMLGLAGLVAVLVTAPRLQELAARSGAQAMALLAGHHNATASSGTAVTGRLSPEAQERAWAGEGSPSTTSTPGQGGLSQGVLIPPHPRLDNRGATLPSGRPLDALEAGLLEQLAEADRQWLPSVVPLPGGGLRYTYKRRVGDPPLTLAQLRQLVANPPTYSRERQVISGLLQALELRGVRLLLTQPRKPGAAGEWEPRRTTIRIRPDVIAKGTRNFARVLNHEVIHVAQSCRGGSLRARPQRLGLPDQPPPALERHLQDPAYAGASPRELALEREAYANQERLGLGQQLLQRFCAVAGYGV